MTLLQLLQDSIIIFTNIGPTLAKAIPKSYSSPVEYFNDKVKESILFSPVLENEVDFE